jgi:hypothetical protein
MSSGIFMITALGQQKPKLNRNVPQTIKSGKIIRVKLLFMERSELIYRHSTALVNHFD